MFLNASATNVGVNALSIVTVAVLILAPSLVCVACAVRLMFAVVVLATVVDCVNSLATADSAVCILVTVAVCVAEDEIADSADLLTPIRALTVLIELRLA